MAETSYNLTNILKVTLDQYNTLKSGGTVGGHTYDSNALYLIKEDPSMTMRQVLSSDPFDGIKTEVFFNVNDDDGYIYIVDKSDTTIVKIDMGVVDYIQTSNGVLPDVTGVTTYGEYINKINTLTFLDYYLISEDEKTKLTNIQEQPIIWRTWS